MELIVRYKKWFIASCIISAVFQLGTTVIAPKMGLIPNGELSRSSLFFIVLPSFVFYLSIMPLVYISWLHKKGNILIYYFKNVVFWLMVLTIGFIYVFFAWHFLLKNEST